MICRRGRQIRLEPHIDDTVVDPRHDLDIYNYSILAFHLDSKWNLHSITFFIIPDIMSYIVGSPAKVTSPKGGKSVVDHFIPATNTIHPFFSPAKRVDWVVGFIKYWGYRPPGFHCWVLSKIRSVNSLLISNPI